MILAKCGNQILHYGYMDSKGDIYNEKHKCKPIFYVTYIKEQKFNCVEIWDKIPINQDLEKSKISEFKKKSIDEFKGWYNK